MLRLGLDLGGCTTLDLVSLSTPNDWGSPEETAIRYLAQSPDVSVDSLLKRLGNGHPKIGATKTALAAIEKRSSRTFLRVARSLSADELPRLWDEWGPYPTSDPLTQAMLLDPEMTVAFLRQRLKPVGPNALQTGLLLSLLAHPSEDVWDKVNKQLERADPRFCMPLESIWQLANTAEQKRRLGRLLVPVDLEAKYYDFNLRRARISSQTIYMLEYRVRKDLPPEAVPARVKTRGDSAVRICEQPDEISREKWFREEAAIWVLEAIGTDDALAIVRRMATGHPEARPTIAAKEVVARRSRK